jgi:hypothetical protein
VKVNSITRWNSCQRAVRNFRNFLSATSPTACCWFPRSGTRATRSPRNDGEHEQRAAILSTLVQSIVTTGHGAVEAGRGEVGVMAVWSKAQGVVGEKNGTDADQQGDHRPDKPFPSAGAALKLLKPAFQRIVEVRVQDAGGLAVDRREPLLCLRPVRWFLQPGAGRSATPAAPGRAWWPAASTPAACLARSGRLAARSRASWARWSRI